MSGMRWTEYQGRGFFTRDGLLEVWLAIVVDEIDRRPGRAAFMASLRDDFQAQATVVFDGIVETRLDPHLGCDGDRRALVALCRELRERLVSGDKPKGPLADRVAGSRWEREDTLAGLSRVAAAFLWLLDEADTLH